MKKMDLRIPASMRSLTGFALVLCVVGSLGFLGSSTLAADALAADEDAKKAEATKKQSSEAKAASAEKLSPLAAAAAASRARKNQEVEEKAIFTTEDLKKRFAGTEPQGGVYQRETTGQDSSGGVTRGSLTPNPNGENPAATVAPKFDPQAYLKQKDADRADARRAREAAQAELAGLRDRVAALEKRRLALVNPFLARPKSEGSDEEKKAWESKDNAARVKQTDDEIAKARSALEDAEKRSGRRGS